MDTLTLWGTSIPPASLQHAEESIHEQRRQLRIVWETLCGLEGASVESLSDATGFLPKTLLARLEELCGAREHPTVAVREGDRWYLRSSRGTDSCRAHP
jgi:hypothetical protein